MYVGDKTSDKLEPVHARMYVQRAGTSSHTKAVTKYLRYYTDIQALELGGYPSIKSIGNCMKNIILITRIFMLFTTKNDIPIFVGLIF